MLTTKHIIWNTILFLVAKEGKGVKALPHNFVHMDARAFKSAKDHGKVRTRSKRSYFYIVTIARHVSATLRSISSKKLRPKFKYSSIPGEWSFKAFSPPVLQMMCMSKV